MEKIFCLVWTYFIAYCYLVFYYKLCITNGVTDMIKQVIVVRKDLNIRKGKLAAQVAHASMKVIFERMSFRQKHYNILNEGCVYEYSVCLTPKMKEWFEGIFTKVVVGCEDLETLKCICIDAYEAGIPHAVIEDCGKTEFDGVKTTTCVALGPDEAEKIDAITGHLTLL